MSSLALLVAWPFGIGVGVGVWCLGMALVVSAYRAQPCGELHLIQSGRQWEGSWLRASGEVGARRSVSCDYLGPWLVGLRVGARRLWVWPDTLSRAQQRALRRCFHRPGR